ncbi:hypothetical protein LXM25_19290 [Dyadobacter sp. LJ53]|uniref:hypothetical protein n=1 Tax=Dyadobacter chenwenxiniae TaxID=2906456 RepID=UPI001F2B8039|nr:hypothetical protein [Dyadobacter chenwenxiniae]MCF0052221.1 hypothetical protein [Dyadobacter chenwenxiniae]
MKPNFKAIDQTEPEFVNAELSDSDLKVISALLQKRKSSKTTVKNPKVTNLKLARK